MSDIITKKELCRICENEGVYNIDQEFFKSSSNDEEYISLSLAFSKFSNLSTQQPIFGSHHQLPQLLCTLCTEKLVLSYEFLIKVLQSDEKYAEYFIKTKNELDEHYYHNGIECENPNNLEEDYFNDIIDTVVDDDYGSVSSSIEKDYKPNIIDDDDDDDNKQNIVEELLIIKGQSPENEIDPLFVVSSQMENVKDMNNLNEIQIKPEIIDTVKNVNKPVPRNKRKQLDLDSQSIILHSNHPPMYVPQYKLSNQLPDDIAAEITKRIKMKRCTSDENSDQDNGSNDDDGNGNDNANNDDERPQQKHHQKQQKQSRHYPKNSIKINNMKTIDVTAVQMKTNETLCDSADAFQKNRSSNNNNNNNNNNGITNNQESSTFVCKYCPKAYSTAHYLIKHTRKSHLCQYCLEAFVKVKDLYQHIRLAHKSFTCSICNHTFSQNSNLRNHVRNVHDINLPAYVSFVPEEADEEMSRKINNAHQ